MEAVVSKLARGDFIENRAFPRQSINFDASFKIGDSNPCYCVIRDFCSGGLYFTFSELDPNLKALEFNDLRRGEVVIVEFISRGKKLRLETRLVRVMEDGMGVSFKVPNPPEIAPLWALVNDAENRKSERPTFALKPGIQQAITDTSAVLSEYFVPLLDKFNELVQSRLLVSAERPSSDQEKHPYIDAIALIERNRASLKDRYIASIRQRLLDSINTSAKDLANSSQNKLSSQLSLIDKEEFEDWLIVKVMISKADMQYRDLLLQLQLRLNEALGGGKERVENPISPSVICYSFRDLIHGYALPVKIERMVYKTFENEVLNELENFYIDFNRRLIEENILPDLSASSILSNQIKNTNKEAQKKKEEAEQNKEDRQDENSTRVEETLSYSKERLTQLLKQQQSHRAHSNQGIKAQAVFSATQDILRLRRESTGQANNAVAKPQNEMVGEVLKANGQGVVGLPDLSNIEQFTETYNSAVMEQPVVSQYNPFEPGALRVVLQKILTSNDPGWSGFNNAEDESIEVVDRLINSIMLNPAIVDEVKPFLNRLRLPLFNLLMKDSEFLVDDKHPARQVLNQMATLGVVEGRFSDQAKQVIEDGVEKIIQKFDAGIQVYSEFLEQLNKVLDQQKRIFDRNISRLAEACDGQEKIEIAKKTVADTINKLLNKRRVPIVIKKLMEGGWRDLMHLSILRKGEESQQWQMSIEVIEALMCYFSENIGTPSYELPQLMKIIRSGLSKTQPNMEQIDYLVSQLRIQIQRGVAEEDWFEWGLKDPEEEAKEAEEEKTVSEKWRRRVRKIQVGEWVRFIIDAKSAHRVRVAWVSQTLERIVFVTKQGIKYRELTFKGLEALLADRKAIIVAENDLPVVDQGLETMVQQIYEQLAFESTHDQVTGLYNRKEFERQVGLAIKEARTGHKQYLLSIYDITQFKVVNSNAGHKAGDALLQEVSEILRSDLPEYTLVARVGDSEFALLIPDCNEQKGYPLIDEKMSKIRDMRFEWDETFFRVGVCIGVMELNENASSVSKTMRDLETCSIAAKEAGGNRIHTFEADDKELVRRRNVLDWVSKVNRAIEDDWLLLRAQRIEPVGRLGSNGEELKPKYEILLSIRDEAGREVTPLDFVRAAEKYNRMQVVDQWVISHVFQWMENNPERVNELESVSINLSGHSINDDRLLKFIFEEFSRKSVPRNKVCFEVTENTAVANLTDAEDFIKEMKNLGCRFSLDDFGTGMSSYAYLKYLPVDYLKIDGSFVKHIAEDEKDFAMVKSMNEMAHIMGKKTIAEYVADDAIFEKLVEIGVDYAQGFLIEKPILLDDL